MLRRPEDVPVELTAGVCFFPVETVRTVRVIEGLFLLKQYVKVEVEKLPELL